MAEPGTPAVAGQPNAPLTDELRFNMQNSNNRSVSARADVGAFLKALCQKLDADAGVADTDFEALFTP